MRQINQQNYFVIIETNKKLEEIRYYIQILLKHPKGHLTNLNK